MNADRNFLGVVLVLVNQIESAWLREIDLVRGDGKFTPDHAPGLDVDLRSIKRRFVWNLDIIDPGIFQHVACHLFGLFPKLRLIDKLLTELGGIVRREAHQVFLNSEELEIIEIHLVHRVELGLELFRRHVKMRVVHLERTHPHQSEQFAAPLVAITGPVLCEPQRQIAITARHSRKQLVMMRAVHRFQVITR